VRSWRGPPLDVEIAMGSAAAGAARRLLERGAGCLVAFGIAGGLAPTLRPGALVVPDAVGEGARTLPLDGAQVRGRLGAPAGTLLSVAAPLADPRAKADAAARGFVAVDMESFAVASAAAAAGVPCVVVRAIADPADRRLPRLASVAVGRDGRLRPFAIAVALASRPGEWPLVLQLARDARAAEASLGRAAAALADLARQGLL
jgi:adenosylhomocysteine nucleosidase